MERVFSEWLFSNNEKHSIFAHQNQIKMDNTTAPTFGRQISTLAEELKGSEIIKLAGEIKAKIAASR